MLEMMVLMTVAGKEKQSQVKGSVKVWAVMPLLPLQAWTLQSSSLALAPWLALP